jgi:basic membrane protein A
MRGTWLILAVVFTLLVAACGGDDDDATTTTTGEPSGTAGQTTTAASGEAFRIAIVAPSASNDLAFSQSIVDAVNVISAERANIEVDVTAGTFVVEDAAAAMRDYASQGYDLVIAHGSQYGGSRQESAPDFPDVSFAGGTAADTFGLANVFSYEAASDEGGYVMGVMAAALSESGVIGVVGPVEVGDAKLYVDGFKAGAEANDSGVTVNVNYTGSFSDVALASEAAQAQISAGADVLSGTAQMVVGAVSVANDAGVLWFGTQANQSSLGDIVVASQVYKWEVVLRDILDKIEQGTLGGTVYEINLDNGGEVIEYNPAFTLPEDVTQLAEQTIAGLIDGSISTGQ